MQRIDKLIVDRGLARSRDEAKRIIMSGMVIANNKVITKPGIRVVDDADIEVKYKAKYVSRGGYKLEKVLNEYNIEVTGKICMDIGASTGGFTDCLLQKGAAKVYAVDVGKGLLDYKLRNNSRIVIIEKTNARYITGDRIPEKVQIITVDVSFISVVKIIPNILNFISDDGILIVLIKPQFESERKFVRKGGIVKNPEIHKQILNKLKNFFLSLGLNIFAITFSPILGQKGNIEYFFILGKNKLSDFNNNIDKLVQRAFNETVKL